ncbi:type II toxin-antitoxin system PrlF family antitoxin [Myxosarcina sp. GI1(2024)]
MNTTLTPPCSESTLTQRYQTTIPAPVRKALNLNRSDKILYTIESDNRVVISRVVEETESDPVLGSFLNFLAKDMKDNPEHIQAVSSDMVNHAKSLVGGVDIDLDAPLLDEDE